MKSKKGFTLIELLVVIAIIAILAAILFPVFAKAREKARQTVCQSNMKQIALGMQQYTQDSDELLPPTRETIGGTVTPWQALIQPYVKSTQLFKCPSNQQKDTNYVDGYNKNGIAIPSSYYANAGYQGSTARGTGGTRPMSDTNSQPIGALESVSSTILVCERNDRNSTSSTNDKINDSREVYDATNGSYLTNHVAGFTGFVFADGHAKMMHPQATLTPANMWVIAAQETTAPSAEWKAAIASADAAMR